jgi:phage baseplate assembly protein V
MIRFGFISDVDPVTAYVRVRFPEDSGFVSAPLPLILPATTGDEYYILPDVGQQVAVMFDENAENGVVLGAIFNKKKKPTQGGADKTYIKFKDGTVISYNRNTHIYTVVMNTTTFEISRDGFKIKRGTETIKKILSDLIDQLVAETHNVTAVGAPTGPPINLAQYNAIKARLTNLLTE